MRMGRSAAAARLSDLSSTKEGSWLPANHTNLRKRLYSKAKTRSHRIVHIRYFHQQPERFYKTNVVFKLCNYKLALIYYLSWPVSKPILFLWPRLLRRHLITSYSWPDLWLVLIQVTVRSVSGWGGGGGAPPDPVGDAVKSNVHVLELDQS